MFLAFQIPFALFIYAYAILGPLHYLTEINWLNDKKYFVKSPWWLFLALGLCGVLVLPKFFNEPSFALLYQIEALKPLVIFLIHWSNAIIFLLLMLALIIISTPYKVYRVVLTIIALIFAFLFNTTPFYVTFIGLFVPTIFHVYLCTIFFMWYGAIKSKSILGSIATILVVIVPVIITQVQVDQQDYVLMGSIRQVYIENKFHLVNILFAKFLGLTQKTDFTLTELIVIKMQIFIAFAYIYHYLNWFSKTTIIGWHKHLTTSKSLLILGIWLFLVITFMFDYKLGFNLALFFSFLHVFLEFPLNWISIKGILSHIFAFK